MNYILIGVGVYLLVRLIFNFIIPVYRTTQRIKKQFRDIQQHAANADQQAHDAAPNSPSSTAEKVGEYIDFEEVR